MSLAAEQLVGTWRLAGDIVEHLVQGSLNPLLIGTRQLRHARLDGDRLILTADESDAAGGPGRRHVIEWRRAGCADT
jgi:hypothetical protein